MGEPRLYESDRLLSVTGPAIRPGGLDLTARALALCPLPAGSRVLDVGCGQGVTVALLRDTYRLAAAGIDVSALLLGRAHGRDRTLPLVRGRAEQLPFADRSIAAVFLECCLSLMPDPAVALAECLRVLATGGHVIVTDIYRKEYASGATGQPSATSFGGTCLAGAASRHCMIERITATGFTLRVWEDHSEALKELAARVVFAYGSLREFWAGACSSTPSGEAALSAADGRPGYCLMWAQKGRP